jgi:hypothetical protein
MLSSRYITMPFLSLGEQYIKLKSKYHRVFSYYSSRGTNVAGKNIERRNNKIKSQVGEILAEKKGAKDMSRRQILMP